MLVDLKKIILYSVITFVFGSSSAKIQVIMINPAGDAKNVGRRLNDGFERTEAYKWAERIQQEIQEQFGVKVVLTRAPGDEIVPLQNASFANRLNADLFLSLHIYKDDADKAKIYVYQHGYNKLIDFARRSSCDQLSFIPIAQAHQQNIFKSRDYISSFKNTFTKSEYQKNFDFFEPKFLPLKPLAGIIAPSIAIEIGINSDNKWSMFEDPLVEYIGQLINWG